MSRTNGTEIGKPRWVQGISGGTCSWSFVGSLVLKIMVHIFGPFQRNKNYKSNKYSLQVIYFIVYFFNRASVYLTDPLPGSGHSSLVQWYPALLSHRQVHPHCRHSSGLQVWHQSQPQCKDQWRAEGRAQGEVSAHSRWYVQSDQFIWILVCQHIKLRQSLKVLPHRERGDATQICEWFTSESIFVHTKRDANMRLANWLVVCKGLYFTFVLNLHQ